jgi:hypothetical protein
MWRGKSKKHLLIEVKLNRTNRGICEYFCFSQVWHQGFEVLEYKPIAVVAFP